VYILKNVTSESNKRLHSVLASVFSWWWDAHGSLWDSPALHVSGLSKHSSNLISQFPLRMCGCENRYQCWESYFEAVEANLASMLFKSLALS